ncbi:MAG TPA: pseudouridine-5'-phosphate glycosidase [Candidatus Limnocylindria bacterium]|nr:pseudouridine-5'-phosphate glycosidase [Candidatus Limnocylindria bacterium]
MTPELVVHEQVARALARGRPVVALESTVITHGLPRPQGVEVARELEAIVLRAGATPATIGVLDGAFRVGLTHAELERLAAEHAAKLNLGNLAAGLASGAPGSTTVSATMFAAWRSGISVFATGGIGGVHHGAAESGDVSADLTALARYPIAVVCAGAKAMLDLAKTVEMLETLGVPVYGFGTDEFPVFYRRQSGLPVERRFDTVDDLARAIRTHFALGLGTGVVVGNPIPVADELPEDVYQAALAGALDDAREHGVRRRDTTPFVLERLRERSGGRTVTANLALLRNNARLAAELASALAHERHEPA